MKEKMMEQFSFTEEFKEKLVLLVMYRNQSVKEVTKSYQLPNVHILNNWITLYKKKLEKGAITLDPMDPKKKSDTAALKQRPAIGKSPGESQCADLWFELHDRLC